MLEVPFCKNNTANRNVGYTLEESSFFFFLRWKVKLHNTCSAGRDNAVGKATA